MLPYTSLLIKVILGAALGAFSVPAPVSAESAIIAAPEVSAIPFYSQFSDVSSSEWQKKSCGVVSLAMIIDWYSPGATTPETLLWEGLSSGAYINNAGWSHQGLIGLARKYGLTGSAHDLSGISKEAAFAELSEYLKVGPIIASVHYKFDPLNPIPHLVVISGATDDSVRYSDPAEKSGNQEIPLEKFLLAWKKRFIAFHR